MHDASRRRFEISSASLLALALSAGLALPAAASEPEPGEGATRVAPVTIIATRSPESVDTVPATVSVITEDEIEANIVTDLKDLVRYEPGLSVPTSPVRFSAALSGAGRDGNSGITIRGLGGDRVLMVVDGVRVPDGFSFGAQNVGRGGYADLDTMSRVEILRGPASALYGSDGVAGAVSFTTRDPDSLLGERSFAGRARIGYTSADEGLVGSLNLAARAGSLSGLVSYTHREASETDNQGTVDTEDASRTRPNPLSLASDAWLGKLVWTPADNHRLRLTLDHFDSRMSGDALSSRSASVRQVLAEDEMSRARVSLDHRFERALGLDQGFWSLYWQQSESRQFTYEDREPLVDRTRDVTFDNRVVGLAVEGQRSLALAGVEHRLVFGGDVSRTRQEGIRDGTVPPAGETFPARPFPITDYTLAGIFVQDDIRLMGGRLVVTPALRFDAFELTPRDDALYTGAIVGRSDSRLSPKLGVMYWATPNLGLYASYGSGFKAPTPLQVNSAFSNPVFGYVSIPNPDLGPETSESVEAGFRLRDIETFGARWALSVTAFHADYDDFISQQVVGGSFTPADPAIYQYVNLTAVRVRGLEARTSLDWDNGVGVFAALSLTEGWQSTPAGEVALASVDPVRLVAGLSYAAPSRRWGGQLVVNASGTRSNLQTRALSCYPGCYRGDAFAVVDATAWWDVTEQASLRVGVFNLLDETYGWWSDVRGLAASSPVLDAYTQPGRNFGVSLGYRF